MTIPSRGSTQVRLVRLGGIVCLLYGLATVAACAFFLAVGLDLHRRLGLGDAFGAPIVLSLIPLAICYGAVLAALGWTALSASPGTSAATNVIAGAYAALAYVGLSRSEGTAVPAAITGAVALALVSAGIGYAVLGRLRRRAARHS